MNKQILCLSAADVHGNKLQYQKIKQLVIEREISFVFLCGDILPKDGGSWHIDNEVRTIDMQADFINNFFIEYLTDLGKYTTVYAIFGNDDFMSNYPLLAEADIPNVHFLNNQAAKLPLTNELYVAGYPYIGVTPFLHKDWEKWDTEYNESPHKIYRTDGYFSENGKHTAIDLSLDAASKTTIRQDLEQLATVSDPRKTIYIFHEAPVDTPLDQIAPDNKYIKGDNLHIGSFAIREFIEQHQPLVTMHGHIHETYDQSGDFKWTHGNSTSMTAANDFTSDTLSCVVFPISNPSDAERLQI